MIGRVLMLPSGRATIKPDYEEGSWGVAHVDPPGVCLLEWERRGKLRDLATAQRARIMVYMAGAETEAELLGRKAIGDDDDRLQIGMMAEELACLDFWGRLEPRLRAMTRMLVRRHRLQIERVAKALLANTSLSAKQIDTLVSPSVGIGPPPE